MLLSCHLLLTETIRADFYQTLLNLKDTGINYLILFGILLQSWQSVIQLYHLLELKNIVFIVGEQNSGDTTKTMPLPLMPIEANKSWEVVKIEIWKSYRSS